MSSEAINDFTITFAKASVTASVFTGTLDITSDSNALIRVAILSDFDKATGTKDGTLKPSSQEFVKPNQIVFTIPRQDSEVNDVVHNFEGSANINGFRVPITFSVTVPPVVVTLSEITVIPGGFFSDCSLKNSQTGDAITSGYTVELLEASYLKNYSIQPNNPLPGITRIKVQTEGVNTTEPQYYVKGKVTVTQPQLTIEKKYSKHVVPTVAWNQFPEPLVPYAVNNMWGNRERDSQYQLELSRLSPEMGFVNDFFYGGKHYRLPAEFKFYHVFAMGGISINFWNMADERDGWDPFNNWVRASEISHKRGVSLDFYNPYGHLFPRYQSLVMQTFQGVTFIAFPVSKAFPIKPDKRMYLRCYSTDINTETIAAENQLKWRFGYEYREFAIQDDLDSLITAYNRYVGYGMGRVIFTANGIVTDITKYTPVSADLLEVYYDPSVEKVVQYQYQSLKQYYSTMDSRNKLLLFPGFMDKPHEYKYFDDCDFYVKNTRTGQGIYYHRNREDAIRQLTHQDYGLCSPYVEFLVDQLITLDKTKSSTEKDMLIQVIYRGTKWKFFLGPTTSRIKDMYLLEDSNKILQAMTGAQSTMKEWQAPELEKSPCNFVLNAIYQELSTGTIRPALGYNGCAVALSSGPLYMPYITPGSPGFEDTHETPAYENGHGYRVPASYVETSTAYEYDKDGLLIRHTYLQNREWFTPGDQTYYVEYVIGKSSDKLDFIISRTDVQIKEGYGFRVYKAGWLIDDVDPGKPDPSLFEKEFAISGDGFQKYPEPTEVKIYRNGELPSPEPEVPDGGRPDGNWVDITDTDEYRIENGVIVWQFDINNYVGMVVFDSGHLYNEFNLSHLDNSIWFTVTHSWEVGGIPLKIEPGQLDVWCNKHPLIENIDYVVDFPRIYIISKMWLNDTGINQFAYRTRGLSDKGLIPSSELGFVQDGVIGYNGRYNLRIDRPTKTIVNGRLFLTDSVDWSEEINHGDNLRFLNGMPYEVKHIYCGNKYVEQNNLYWGFNESRELDQRVSDYLTEYVTYKPSVPLDYPYLEKDRYRVYSSFLSQLINDMVLGFVNTPEPDNSEIGYSDQAIDTFTRPYQWLLKYDPIIRGFDERFFSFQPYSNMGLITVTPNQLTIIARVNKLYLKDMIKLEAYFEVTPNV